LTNLSPQTVSAPAQLDIADTVKQVAADIGISLSTLYREAALKRIRISKIGSRSLIFRSDRAAYVALLKSEADAARAAASLHSIAPSNCRIYRLLRNESPSALFADWPIWAEPQPGEFHGRSEQRR
jgi:hypothetical protein